MSLAESATWAMVRLRKKAMNLCASEGEERRHGEGAGVHATPLSDTLYSIGFAESATWARVRLRKNPMNLCASVSEERGHGEGAGAHATLLSDAL